jgi:hypothetical protein
MHRLERELLAPEIISTKKKTPSMARRTLILDERDIFNVAEEK